MNSPKSKILSITLLLIFLVLGVGLAFSLIFADRAKIYVEKDTLDFGNFIAKPEGMTVFKKINIVNTTDKDVKIQDVLATCNCIVVHGKPDTLPAKSTTPLTFSMTLNPPDVPGKNLQMTILLEHPTIKKLEFTAKATMEKSCFSVPEKLNFGDISNRENNPTQYLTINLFGFSKDVKISEISTTSPEIVVSRLAEKRRDSLSEENDLPASLKSFDTLVTLNLDIARKAGKTVSFSDSIKVRLTNGNILQIPVSFFLSEPQPKSPNNSN